MEAVILNTLQPPVLLHLFSYTPSSSSSFLPHSPIPPSIEAKKVARERGKKDATEGAEEVDEDGGLGCSEDDKKRKAGCGGSGKKAAVVMRCCQAERCTADLADAKQYHRRHKVCEHHAKAQVVAVGGIRQRFCQQCNRFHELSEFDEAKRSCRRRLAGHNERRRKNSADQHHGGGGQGSTGRKGTGGSQLKELVCGQVDDRGRIEITVQENATYKHFQIR